MRPGRPTQTPGSRLPAGAGQQPPSQVGIPASLLFQGSQEILINHHGEIYRLRLTRNNKLILTK
ncbi:MAG: hemin uptake protein HemP [Hydrogenophilales bacterium]|nr:hemin uptake protein HemP [Hydrogenophilales bacterium]